MIVAFQMLGLERGEPEMMMALGPLAVILLGSVLPAVLKAAGNVVSSNKQSAASRRATEAQTAATKRAEDWEREQDALDRAERARADEENRRRWDVEADRDQARYDADLQESRRQWAADERWAETRDKRMAPYREGGVAALQQLGSLAGITIRPSQDAPTPDMTEGWDNSSLSPSRDLPPATATGRRSMATLAGR